MKNSTPYRDKHGPDPEPDPRIQKAIEETASEKRLSCAKAFSLAKALNVAPAQVGKNLDLLDYRLVKCQLGLFGYSPKKKIVQPELPKQSDLLAALRALKGPISCQEVWRIADSFGVSKMTVASGCEALGIKIKPCQLGAF